MPGPRPAIKCNEGVLVWQGMTTTPMNMREARLTDKPWDFRCCSISQLTCSEPATFAATPVPEPPLVGVGLIVGVLLIGALYERSWERRRNRGVQRVRVKRQRKTIRRWLREVLRRRL